MEKNKPLVHPDRYTWERLVNLKEGTVVYVSELEQPRFMIRKGYGSLCGYIGYPKNHPITNLSHIVLDKLNVHGGVTFDGEFDAKGLIGPEVSKELAKELSGYHWFGWDYAHFGDYFMFYDKPDMAHIFKTQESLEIHKDEKKWGVEDVIQDSLPDIIKFNNFLKINYRLLQVKNWINKVLRRKNV